MFGKEFIPVSPGIHIIEQLASIREKLETFLSTCGVVDVSKVMQIASDSSVQPRLLAKVVKRDNRLNQSLEAHTRDTFQQIFAYWTHFEEMNPGATKYFIEERGLVNPTVVPKHALKKDFDTRDQKVPFGISVLATHDYNNSLYRSRYSVEGGFQESDLGTGALTRFVGVSTVSEFYKRLSYLSEKYDDGVSDNRAKFLKISAHGNKDGLRFGSYLPDVLWGEIPEERRRGLFLSCQSDRSQQELCIFLDNILSNDAIIFLSSCKTAVGRRNIAKRFAKSGRLVVGSRVAGTLDRFNFSESGRQTATFDSGKRIRRFSSGVFLNKKGIFVTAWASLKKNGFKI